MSSKVIPLPFVPLNLETGEEGKKLQKFEYLENQKSFLNEIKNIFCSFYRALIWCKKSKN